MTIKRKLVAISRSASLDLASVREVVKRNPEILRQGTEAWSAKRAIVDDLISRYPPWGDQVREQHRMDVTKPAVVRTVSSTPIHPSEGGIFDVFREIESNV